MASSNTAELLNPDKLGNTERNDAWWTEPLLILIALGGFTVYVLWVLMQNANYVHEPYLSPIYSPNLGAMFPDFFASLGIWGALPVLFVLWIPLAFRATCYYARRVAYRGFFWTPPACSVGPSEEVSKRYEGETKFPFVLMNMHRYFFYLAAILTLFHWSHIWEGMHFKDGMGFGVGTFILLLDAIFLSLYVFSCHAWRHLIGGKLDCFSCDAFSENRHAAWHKVSLLNERHGLYFWLSLFTIGLADLYVRLCATGVITDMAYVFGQGWIANLPH